MKNCFGSVRRSSMVEAEVVLATGVYLTFRLKQGKTAHLRNLVEVGRARARSRPGDTIVVHPRLLQHARHEAFRAIVAHGATIRRLPDSPRAQHRTPYQLSFIFLV